MKQKFSILQSEFKKFNAAFEPEKYQRLKENIDKKVGAAPFRRLCETPVFIPKDLFDEIKNCSNEIITQAMSPSTLAKVEPYVMDEFKLNKRPTQPNFILVDFAMADDGLGGVVPKLVEMQSSSSLFLFMMLLAKEHKDIYKLGDEYGYLDYGVDDLGYIKQIRNAVLGNHKAKHVALLDIEPQKETSLVDYNAFEQIIGIKALGIRDIVRKENKLYYHEGNDLIQIHRVYNRIIPEDFAAKNLREIAPFNFKEELDVEWLSHPHWDFLMSKATMPHLNHRSVPKTYYLNEIKELPKDIENYVLKPIFAYGGRGVKINITDKDITEIPTEERSGYVLMEKIRYCSFVENLTGEKSKAEVRLMFTWSETGLTPAIMMARVFRGEKSNTSSNQYQEDDNWVGVAPVMWVAVD